MFIKKKIEKILSLISSLDEVGSVKVRIMFELSNFMSIACKYLPIHLQDHVELARNYWRGIRGDSRKIEMARVECWEFLDGKNRSAGIGDPEDAAVRSLICLLYEESNDEVEVADIVELFFGAFSFIPLDGDVVESRIDEFIEKLGRGVVKS